MKNTAAKKRKQIPEGYLVVGVDPHKKRHAAVMITQDFTTQAKFKFENNREGLEMMLDSLFQYKMSLEKALISNTG